MVDTTFNTAFQSACKQKLPRYFWVAERKRLFSSLSSRPASLLSASSPHTAAQKKSLAMTDRTKQECAADTGPQPPHALSFLIGCIRCGRPVLLTMFISYLKSILDQVNSVTCAA